MPKLRKSRAPLNHARHRLRVGNFESLEPRCLLATDVVISEFMAINNGSLTDGDGDTPDWIELHNPSTAPIDLAGWHLTDDPGDLTKWEFPATTLEAESYLIVFASGKNNPPAGELHASFRLDGDGEYLALVKPDGETITTEFNTFPRQVSDVSFGLDVNGQPSTLVSADGPLAALVPDDGSLGDDWQLVGFDDAGWLQGNGGVGFGADPFVGLDIGPQMEGINSSAYIRAKFNVADASIVDTMSLNIQYDDGFVAYLNGQEIASRNARSPAVSPLSGLVSYWNFEGGTQDNASVYLNNSGVAADNLTPRGGVARYEPGIVGQALAIGVQGGDPTDLSAALSDDVKLPAVYAIEAWVKPTELADAWQRLVLNWGPEQSYHFAIRNNSGFDNAVSLFHGEADGGQPNANGGTVKLNQWQHIAGVADGERLRVYLDGVEVNSVPYDGTIHTAANEGLGIADSFSSLSTIKFNGLLDELAIWEVPLTAAQIQSHFEAGAEGYGLTEVGANTEIQWDSAAANVRDSAVEDEIESIDVAAFTEFIQPGDNVLAIQGMNAASDGQDFLIRAELAASDIALDTNTKRYFTLPTPGAANRTGVADLGPIVDEVHHEFLPPPGITSTSLVDSTSSWQAFVPADDSLGRDWVEPDYVVGSRGEAWTVPTPGGVGFDLDDTYDALIGTDLETAMHGNNASAYLRAEFDVADPSMAERLKLNIQYDDGFIAYLNGQPVAARNSPGGGISPPAGLTTYYSFDGDVDDHAVDFTNSSSTVDDDLSALAASGAVNTSFATGVVGQAVRISRDAGEATVLSAADSDDLDLAADWTVEAFVNPDSANMGEWDRFATKWFPGTTSWHWAFRGANNGLDLFLNGTQVINNATTATVPLNEWSHVAITGSSVGGTIKAWLNGIEVGSAPYVSVANGNAPLTLGNFRTEDTALQFSGLIDEFAIWNVALTGVQLLAHANGGAAGYGLTPIGGDPNAISWNAAAEKENPDAAAVVPEQIDISNFASLLHSGTNVLAIQGLNESPDDRDFLIVPQLAAESGSESDGPLQVTARVSPTMEPVGDVSLTYRVMFDEEASLVMFDDGTGGDAAAGDGVYTALIPTSTAAAGEMIRYYISAADTEMVPTREPLFADPNNSPEYYGTIIADPSNDTQLPVLHRFIENTAAAETGSGTRGAIFYNGEFYDNVFIRIRGGTARSWPKKSYKIEFNDGYHFLYRADVPRVDEFNLNTTYTDKAYMRAILAYDTHAAAGSPASETFAMQVRQNGEFFSVAHFVEQPDRDFLRRVGLDADGSLYKGNANPTNGFIGSATSGAFEKKTRKDEDFSDLQEFIDGLALTGQDLENYLFDNVDLAAQVNFMAVNVIMQNIDATDKNFYIYRDTEGDGEWQMLPWDLDLVYGPNALNTDTIVYDEDGPPAHTSHPYLGTLAYPFHGRKNHLFDAIVNIPRTNEMFLRRVRTLMDDLLTSADTPEEERFVENRIDELVGLLGPDVLLDRQRWGSNAHFPGATYSLQQAADRIKNDYLAPRRMHLFETHSIDAVIGMETTVIPMEAPKRAFVPRDGSLGTSWTQIGFDDNQWLAGTSGVGYEEQPADFLSFDESLGIDLRSPEIPADQRIDTDGDGTNENDSVYVRVPFDVANPAELDQLRLRMRYDDGFVAYLNGVEVARANTPETVQWNSSAATNRLDIQGRFVWQEFDIAEFGGPNGVLVAGTNVLAIHGLNEADNGVGTAMRMIVFPELLNGFPPSTVPVGIPREQVGNPVLEFGAVDVNPASGNQDEEFIELVNPNDFAVDVSNWRIAGGVTYTIQPGTVLPANDSLYLTPSLPAFRARAVSPRGDSGLFAQGPYTGHLSSFGETIQLISADGTPIAEVTTPSNPSDVQQYLRVSEIHYNPAGDDDTEFMELVNIAPALTPALDLGGVAITSGPAEPFTLPAGTSLGADQYLLIVKDVDAFRTAYPEVDSSILFGPYAGSLSNGGERIKIDDATGSTVVDFTFGDNRLWPQAADDVGASLELIDPQATQTDRLSKPDVWSSSVESGGTPGSPRSAPVPIVISEVLAHSDLPGTSDAIELYNDSDAAIDIGGWWLSDASDDLFKFQIPQGTTLGARRFIVFDESDFNPTPATPGPKDFALSGAAGDDVWLVDPDGAGGQLHFIDDVHFGASFDGQTLGLPSFGNRRLAPMSRNTLGCSNSNVQLSAAVISEILYAPANPAASALAIAPNLDANDLEYIEIALSSDTPVDLTGWRIRGGVDFDFAAGTMLDGPLLVISFDPQAAANANKLAAFRQHYGLSIGIPIVGGYAGSLNDNGEQLRLEQPDIPPSAEPTLTPYVTVDEVIYDNFAPWPTTANGSGNSLQRVAPVYYGNSSFTWQAAGASPGSVEFVSDLMADLNGDQLVDARDVDALLDATSFGVDPSHYDFDGNGQVESNDVAVFLASIGSLLGDANLDGVVNAADLNLVGVNWLASHCVNWSGGDFSGDGAVTAVDLNAIGLHWRQSAAALAVVRRVPRAPLHVALATIPGTWVDALSRSGQLESSQLGALPQFADNTDIPSESDSNSLHTKRARRYRERLSSQRTVSEVNAKWNSETIDLLFSQLDRLPSQPSF